MNMGGHFHSLIDGSGYETSDNTYPRGHITEHGYMSSIQPPYTLDQSNVLMGAPDHQTHPHHRMVDPRFTPLHQDMHQDLYSLSEDQPFVASSLSSEFVSSSAATQEFMNTFSPAVQQPFRHPLEFSDENYTDDAAPFSGDSTSDDLVSAANADFRGYYSAHAPHGEPSLNTVEPSEIANNGFGPVLTQQHHDLLQTRRDFSQLTSKSSSDTQMRNHINSGDVPMESTPSNSSTNPLDTNFAAQVLQKLKEAIPDDSLAESDCESAPLCEEPDCDPKSEGFCPVDKLCYKPDCSDKRECVESNEAHFKPHGSRNRNQAIYQDDQDYAGLSTFVPKVNELDVGFSNSQRPPRHLCPQPTHDSNCCVAPRDLLLDNNMMPPLTYRGHSFDPTNTQNSIFGSTKRHQERHAHERSSSGQTDQKAANSGFFLHGGHGDLSSPSEAHSIQSSPMDNLLRSPASPYTEAQSSKPMSREVSGTVQCYWMDHVTGFPCNRGFDSSRALQRHVEDEHMYPPGKGRVIHECHWRHCRAAVESKNFKQAQHLKDHIRAHTQYKPYMCEYILDDIRCEREFSDKKGLDSHTRSHTKEKPFRCEVCSKCFSHQSSLATHKLQHQGEVKKYECPVCGHKDNDRANYGRHLDTHNTNRFKCGFCGQNFGKKANTMRHLRMGSCKVMRARHGQDLDAKEIANAVIEIPRDPEVQALISGEF